MMPSVPLLSLCVAAAPTAAPAAPGGRMGCRFPWRYDVEQQRAGGDRRSAFHPEAPRLRKRSSSALDSSTKTKRPVPGGTSLRLSSQLHATAACEAAERANTKAREALP